MKEKQRKSLTGSFNSFTLKACSIKKRRVFRYLRPISIGDFVTEMEWQPLVSANQEQYMILNVTTDFYWCIDMPPRVAKRGFTAEILKITAPLILIS